MLHIRLNVIDTRYILIMDILITLDLLAQTTINMKQTTNRYPSNCYQYFYRFRFLNLSLLYLYKLFQGNSLFQIFAFFKLVAFC